ncbi:MAG: hypothetical protein Q8O48_01065, partial [Anaerolineales bacterium]|nr:hypothetical protein [Anaerolineales bacterium]
PATPTEAFTATEVPSTATVVSPSRPLSNLSADPQRKEFQAEDGKNLVGYYYPSKYAEAPTMILMHWAGGDLTDWCEIALWLQNRRDENPANPERCAEAGSGLPAGMSTTWLDPTWFPPMALDVSIAVFAFDFRDYGESEAGGAGPNWVKDAKAAFVTAARLEGVDATRMASMGASIGADGAPDGCLLYNQEAGSGCVGALSLSPGSYLDMNFATVVNDLAPIPAWCLAGELDNPSASTCKSASGEAFRSEIYPGSNDHGMMLIVPGLDPLPMILIQDFLELVFGEKAK